MNDFEKRLMKLEKKQLAVTISTMLEVVCKDDDGIDNFVTHMETHEYRKYLNRLKWLAMSISFVAGFVIVLFIQLLVGALS